MCKYIRPRLTSQHQISQIQSNTQIMQQYEVQLFLLLYMKLMGKPGKWNKWDAQQLLSSGETKLNPLSPGRQKLMKNKQNYKLNSAFICNTSQQTASGFQSDWITRVLSNLNIYAKKKKIISLPFWLKIYILDQSVNNQKITKCKVILHGSLMVMLSTLKSRSSISRKCFQLV